MKKLSIILAMVAMVLGFSSCKQEDEPQYHNPTHFILSTPALQNQAFLCGNDMTDKATFNLFCTQPDYGYSAICNYSALVSLDPSAPIEEWIALPNETPNMASMSIKTYELGVAIVKLLGYESEEEFAAANAGDKTYVAYFKAVCEIPGIDGSKIISDNYVSYNKVNIQYAEKKPGWIYICGNVADASGEHVNGFTAPSPSNLADYDAYWSLYEPDNMIGEKVYVGKFIVTAKDNGDELGNPDAASQFRFFTELLGWSPDASLGSNKDDFYCLPITDKVGEEYKGPIVNQGLGNWGIHCTEPTPVTIVVDAADFKIYVKEGFHDVTFTGHNPSFE